MTQNQVGNTKQLTNVRINEAPARYDPQPKDHDVTEPCEAVDTTICIPKTRKKKPNKPTDWNVKERP